jgi:hypothetical protein
MFEAFKIGVQISLMSNAASVLSAMSGQLMGVHGHVGNVNRQFTELELTLNRIKKQAMIGGALMSVGAFGLTALKGPYEEAKKLAQAQANFQTLNLSSMENSEAFGKAAQMSHKILGTTITDNVKLIHDLHTAFGDLHHAIGSADMFAKMSIVAKIANGGKDVDGLTNAAAKALENRGGKVVNDPSAFAAEVDMMTKVMLGTKMRVSPMDYLTASGTGKMAYQMYDKEYLYGNFAGMMAINGGARSGTEGMTAFSSLIGGHMDSKGKGFMSELGLWEEGVSPKRLALMRQATKGMSKEDMKSMGMLTPTTGGLSDINSELFAHRPDIFIASVLVPAIKKRFGMDLSDDQMALLVSKNFNRSTGNDLGTQITMASKLSKDTAIFGKSMGIGQAYQAYMKTPEGAEEAASAAWKNFLAVFGSVYLPTITKGLLKLAGVLDSLGQFVSEHSTLTKGFVYLFGIISVACAAGGAVILAGTAFTALGTAISFLGGGAALGVVSTAFVAMGAMIGPVALGFAAIAATMGLIHYATKDAKAGPKENFNEDFYAGRGNQSSRYYGLTSKAGGGRGSQGAGDVYLDGRKVGEIVSNHQGADMNRPPTGSRVFDGSMNLRAVGAR